MSDSMDLQKLALQLPKIEPCCFCGLPLLEELTTKSVDNIWRCNAWDECYERAMDQVYRFRTDQYPVEKEWYKTILKGNPHYPWEYKFTCHIRNDHPRRTYSTELTIDGPWNIHSFPAIIKDALEFAGEYEAINIRVTNEADDILWEDS